MEPPPVRMFATVGQPRAQAGARGARRFTLLVACGIIAAVLLFRWELTSRPRLTVVEVSLGLRPAATVTAPP